MTARLCRALCHLILCRFLCTVFDRYLNAEAKDMQQAIDGSMLRE